MNPKLYLDLSPLFYLVCTPCFLPPQQWAIVARELWCHLFCAASTCQFVRLVE